MGGWVLEWLDVDSLQCWTELLAWWEFTGVRSCLWRTNWVDEARSSGDEEGVVLVWEWEKGEFSPWSSPNELAR